MVHPQFVTVRGDDDILWLLSVSCCPRKCTRKLSIEDINACELHFTNMDQTQEAEVCAHLPVRPQ